MQVHLFISDLHLSSQRPATTALFLRFLRERAVPATALYILGDLFDAWVGDDDERPPIPEIVTAMKALSDVGTTLYFMPGNRDFLIGERFIRASGCRPLPDPYILAQPDRRILLMHGDLLCSDDRDYQAWRQRLRNPAFIEQLLARPIAERIAIAADYRRRSGEATSLKPADIIDVNQQTVEHYLREQNARLLIHGHTHRPADHRFTLDGAPADRMVLPEWHERIGGYLSLCGDSINRQVFI